MYEIARAEYARISGMQFDTLGEFLACHFFDHEEVGLRLMMGKQVPVGEEAVSFGSE